MSQRRPFHRRLFTRRRSPLVLGALILAVPLAGAASPAYADGDTGSISGQLTTDGQPRTDYEVELTNSTGFYQETFVEGSDTFQFTDVPPGQYIVDFWFDGTEQWYHGKAQSAGADPVTVVAGQDTAITDSTLPTGTITGTLTDSAGDPVAATVEAYDPRQGLTSSAKTGPDGRYSMTPLPGDYQILFFPQQYPALQVHDPATTDITTFTVAAGSTVTVDEQLPPVGSMSGRFTNADGQPEANVAVDVWGGPGVSGGGAVTGGDGGYTIPYLYAGTDYTVSFHDFTTGQTQWAYGQRDEDDATRFAVIGGADTVVSDQALGPPDQPPAQETGSITVTARNSVTHAIIPDICADAGPSRQCSDGTGQVTLTEVPVGSQAVSVHDPDDTYVVPPPQAVTVSAGATTAVAFTMTPGASIDTVVRDARTGAPVAGVCVLPYATAAFVAPDGSGYCSDGRGRVHIGPIVAGRYRLYATSRPDGPSAYGDQWVGTAGGVGVQTEARVVSVKTGQKATVPPIRMDGAGTVTGVVTGTETGSAVAGAVVDVAADDPDTGAQLRGAVTDAGGRYTITGLGPYPWPLGVQSSAEPWQWTGQVANRTRAATVRVRAGASVTGNIALAPGVGMSGTVRGADGTLDTSGRIVAYNAGTGDPVGVSELSADGAYHLSLLGAQSVKLYVVGYAHAEATGWYGGADLAHATAVRVPAHRDLSLDITIG